MVKQALIIGFLSTVSFFVQAEEKVSITVETTAGVRKFEVPVDASKEHIVNERIPLKSKLQGNCPNVNDLKIDAGLYFAAQAKKFKNTAIVDFNYQITIPEEYNKVENSGGCTIEFPSARISSFGTSFMVKKGGEPFVIYESYSTDERAINYKITASLE